MGNITSANARFLFVAHAEIVKLSTMSPSDAAATRKCLARCMLTTTNEWEKTYTQQLTQHMGGPRVAQAVQYVLTPATHEEGMLDEGAESDSDSLASDKSW